jgi:hypothetical protein
MWGRNLRTVVHPSLQLCWGGHVAPSGCTAPPLEAGGCCRSHQGRGWRRLNEAAPPVD